MKLRLAAREVAGAEWQGAPGAAAQGKPAPLLVHNLLNDFAALAPLLLGELRQGSWLNTYLLAAGLNQITEDYLHWDPYYPNKAALFLARLPEPAGRLAAGIARRIDTALWRLYRRAPRTLRLLEWQAELAAFVQRLAEMVVCPGSASAARSRELLEEGAALFASPGRFPHGLRRSVLRLPACFRSFDQDPGDIERIVGRFADRWPERARPLVVVGVRTSGSYLAPLYAAVLTARGYQRVRVLTVRPGRRLLGPEQAMLQDAIGGGGLALLIDDPPTTGGTLARAATELERTGFPSHSIILPLQVFGPPESLPPRLQRYPAVLLPWEEWTVHEKLTPAAIQVALTDLFGPAVTARVLERLPLPPRRALRGHVHALYRVQFVDRDSGRRREQRVFVKGAGLGYFGEHALAVARPLRRFLPEVYGVGEGLVYRAWLPEERRLSAIEPAREDTVATAMAAYVLARHRALAVDEDVSLRLAGHTPAWEAAGSLLRQAFGRSAWLRALVRPAAHLAAQRLLRVEHPSVVDGSMDPSRWFAGEAGEAGEGALLKIDFDKRAFWSGDMYCYDRVFDLAALAAGFDLAGLAADLRESGLPGHLRRAYEGLSAGPVGAERWLLYQLLHLQVHLREQRHQVDRLPDVHRALSRAQQRYFAEVLFKDVPSPRTGAMCAIDIDGVLETGQLGFTATSPAGALALRALTLHGYRPVLATGRSLADVRDRCEAYRLAGGVAEYGAVVYNHELRRARPLLSEADRDDLDRLRAVLSAVDGVHLEPHYRYAVRAYRFNRAGERQGLPPETAAAALAESGTQDRIRAIAGGWQTDFMVAGIDKGTGLRALAEDLGVDTRATCGKPLALAVGDTVSDLPMFELAARACAPANADLSVRTAGVEVLERPQQAGLALATYLLLGHRSGGCPACRLPRLSPGARLLLGVLSAQDAGKWGKLKQALLLGARVGAPAVLAGLDHRV